MKLARKIIFVLLATYLALLGVLGYFEVRRAVADHETRVRDELTSVGQALRPAFLEVWQVEGEERAKGVLDRANRDDLELVLTWTPRPGEDPTLTVHDRAALLRGETVTLKTGEGADERMTVVVPARGGVIRVSREITGPRAMVVRAVETHLFSASATVLAAALISSLAGLWLIGTPMRVLVEQARRIGHGDLEGRLPGARKDEIGELASQMNLMCDRLLAANARVQQEADARIAAVEQLRHADRLRTVGTLASGMAHELGTPLSVVAGRAKMIASGSHTPEEDVKFAQIIAAQAARMTKIMRGLLDFARAKTVPKRPGDLREVVARTFELIAPLAKKSQIDLRMDAADDLPQVDMDASQVEQALANLVVNGIHAMSEGGELVVTLGVVQAIPPPHHGGGGKEGEYVRVRVHDSGRGIAKQDLSRVFEPFFTTKEIGEGTGLGLAIVHGILSDHGGWIDVESEPEHGSTFFCYFPKSRAS